MIIPTLEKSPSVTLNILNKADRLDFETLASDKAVKEYANLDCWLNGISSDSMWRAVEIKQFTQYNYFSVRNETSFVGAASLVNFNNSEKFVEIGFWIGREFWKRGYGREVVNLLIIKALENPITQCVFARCRTDNDAAIALLKYFLSIEKKSNIENIIQGKENCSNQHKFIFFSRWKIG